jgi:hypothetical protein
VRFESVGEGEDFVADVVFDADGLVLDYPGIATGVRPAAAESARAYIRWVTSWMRSLTAGHHAGRGLTLCVVLVLGLAGCGAGGRLSATTSTTTPNPPPPHRARRFVSTPANALVTMRRLSPKSLMWQTLFVRRDGSGVLTSLIGEISGAPQRPFRLSGTQLARLHHLVAAARPVRARSSGSGDFLYTLSISGAPASSLEGQMPRQLSALVGYLGGLMTTYCC